MISSFDLSMCLYSLSSFNAKNCGASKQFLSMWGETSWEHTVVEKNYVIC